MSLRLAVIALMLLAAGALGMIAYQIAQPHRVSITMAPDAPPPPLTVGYLVAARPLPAGTLARDEDFLVKSVLPDQLPAGAITDAPEARASLRGALIRTYLDAGTPVAMIDVLRPRDRGFLAAVLEPGTRALSVGVDAVTGVSGLIWPGDRVDVILTQELEREATSAIHRVLSETILTDARVIAVDQEITQGAPASLEVAGRVARTVTLQVAADNAERLTVAERLGKISLAIRAIEGPGAEGNRPALFGGDVSPALSALQQPAGTRVQVIEGGKRSEVNFR